jgi:hypothetical protein
MRKTLPKPGDTRVIRRWAVFPIVIDGEERWLESCIILQRWTNMFGWQDAAFLEDFDAVPTEPEE